MPRVDAADKVTGRAIYTDDIHLPNMIHGKILGSPMAHGRLKRIDTSKAEALPGVLCVLTGADVPDTMYGVSPARYDEYVLAKDKVRHVGDEVAAVAAVDEETAERAVALIEVEYEELPAVLDPLEAVKPGAPQLHERYERNINTHVDHSFGDIEKGFAESHHVREETFTGNHVYQCPLEPHAAIATWDHARPVHLDAGAALRAVHDGPRLARAPGEDSRDPAGGRRRLRRQGGDDTA
jgi:4-hydroxybenzoyl-CoA reductase subunit alpha